MLVDLRSGIGDILGPLKRLFRLGAEASNGTVRVVLWPACVIQPTGLIRDFFQVRFLPGWYVAGRGTGLVSDIPAATGSAPAQ